MSQTIELPDDVYNRLQDHRDADQTVVEFIAELVSMYETEGTFLQEGYSE